MTAVRTISLSTPTVSIYYKPDYIITMEVLGYGLNNLGVESQQGQVIFLFP